MGTGEEVMSLPEKIHAVRRIVFDVEEIKQAVREYMGREATEQDVINYIKDNAYDEFGTTHFSLYNPEQDRDIS